MSDEKPNPEDVEPISNTDGVYQRDSDGNLRPIEDVVKWGDEWRRVKFYPIPTGDLFQFQEMGQDIQADEMCEIMSDKVHTPDRSIDEWKDTEPDQFMSIFTELVKKATGEEPSGELHAQIQDELDNRAAAGN